MNGCSDPAMWAARTDYINRFVLKFMKDIRQEYLLRRAAAVIWDRRVEEYLTCRCGV